MSKQTRLNFGQASSAPAKRRRLNTSESLAVEDDDDGNKKTSESSSKTKPTGQNPSLESESETTNNPKNKNPTTQTHHKPTQTQTSNSITLTHHHASLFAAPQNTLLCHATNAQGTWGAGIAAAFKKSYPAACKMYATHCAKWPTSALLGTTFLIPPQKDSFSKAEREAQHWIGCLFTSEKKGKGKGSKESILEATGDAVRDLVRKVRDVNEDAAANGTRGGRSRHGAIASVRMCKINSGLFGVPWEATSAVVEGIEVEDGDLKEIEVFSMD
jgi:ADP-ribose 1''-phosphate phosphatase